MVAIEGERTRPRRALERMSSVVPWTPVIVAWAVSRAIATATLMIAGSRTAPHPDITRLVMWDGGWYQAIAHTGYGPPPTAGQWSTWPFFPLYPALVRGLHEIGSPYSFAMVLIANVAALAALAGVWRIARRHVSPRAAVYAVWITALFPGALTFSMGYPDSLFLAGSVWAFALLDERRPWAAGVAALVATAARPNGFVVLIALAVAVIWPRRARRPAGSAASDAGAVLGRVLGPGLAFLLGWSAVLWYHTGNPFVFLSAKEAWREITIVDAPGHLDALVHVVLAVVLLVPFVVRWRRQPPAWIVLVALSLLPSLALGVIGLARYAIQCFPLALAAGQAVEKARPRTRQVVVGAIAAGLVGFALLVTRASYVP